MKPTVVAAVEEVRRAVALARGEGKTIGLVPTMGALHAGHASLIERAVRENTFVVVTIFVNPTQFGPHEDLSRYPRPLEHDLAVCAREGAALVFAPEPGTMYPPGFCTWVEVHGLQDVLEGASRPGHFRGVATVVLKLFNIVQPDRAYFGQKDGQQTRIIQQMVRDLDVPVELVICPTVREADGLALSSRNVYLDAAQRSGSTVLSQALGKAKALIESGERDAEKVRREMIAHIATAPDAVLDYVAVVNAETLQPIARIHGDIMLALAVKFGGTRLIDNVPLSVRDG